jgi:pilus assembly protein Flp/PilA
LSAVSDPLLTDRQSRAAKFRDIKLIPEVMMRSGRVGPACSKIELNFRTIRGLIEDRRGVTAIEYALIAALVAVAAIAAMSTLGGSISGTFTQVANSM